MQRLLSVTLGLVTALAFAPLLRADCDVAPNLLQFANCGFTTDVASWTVVLGSPVRSDDGMPGPGSLEMASTYDGSDWSVYALSTCVADATALSGANPATFSFQHRLVAGSDVTCQADFAMYSGPACSGAATSAGLQGFPSLEWGETSRVSSAAPGISFKAWAYCYASAPFTVRLDTFWAGPGTTVPVELVWFAVD